MIGYRTGWGMAVLGVLGAAQPVHATNGTQLTAYGAKAQGMGGVSLAYPQDAIAAANNPAGMARIGNRFDIGTQVIGVWTDSTAFGTDNEGSALAPALEFGANYQLNDRWSVGVSTAATGAALKYDDQIITGLPDGTEGTFIGVAVLPTVTYKASDTLAIGASIALASQALDVENFPGLPGYGMEWAYGAGLRAGILWTARPGLSIGASYTSKISMSSFPGYRSDLLALVDGKLDMPEQYGVGIAYQINPQLTVAADYLRINWGDTQFSDVFGYRDQDVVRVGASYDVDDKWTVRSGASFANRHITSDSVVPNLVLSGINSDSVSFGATRRLANGGEITMGFEYDYGSRLDGTGPSAGSFIDTEMGIVSVSYGKTF